MEEISREGVKENAKGHVRGMKTILPFYKWRQDKKVINVSDDIPLDYLSKKSKTKKASAFCTAFL